MVTEVEFDEGEVVRCLIEAVMTKREEAINWRDLTDNQTWLQVGSSKGASFD